MEKLEKILNYRFADRKLLREALTHPSATILDQKKRMNYQRLEFLGDSVLSLVVSEMLLELFPHDSEGNLATKRAFLVSGHSLAAIADKLEIIHFMQTSAADLKNGAHSNRGNLENLLEALIGSMYLDGGLIEVREFIIQHWKPIAENLIVPPKDPKSAVQEWAQKRGKALPKYELIGKSGPDHLPIFTIKLIIEDEEAITAEAKTVKLAENLAASEFLKRCKS